MYVHAYIYVYICTRNHCSSNLVITSKSSLHSLSFNSLNKISVISFDSTIRVQLNFLPNFMPLFIILLFLSCMYFLLEECYFSQYYDYTIKTSLHLKFLPNFTLFFIILIIFLFQSFNILCTYSYLFYLSIFLSNYTLDCPVMTAYDLKIITNL